MRTNLLIFIPILFFFACSQNNSDKTESDPLWGLEEKLLKSGEDLAVDGVNSSIEKATSMRLNWAYSPLSIALRVAGQQMISPEVKILAKSMSGNELITHVVVMVEKQNLQDDSLDDQYYRIELKLGGSIWQVTDIKKAWSCKANRGHTEVSAEICK